ncbi:hypothetical protein ACFC1R_23335 [Kitasatospora sp. NPDC056138]|uniref:hypothetical protein n=1 Tax=Kitasatospora sp. NPDC056138 TaxID=3345724 RepID=UPI0035E1D52B
MFVRRPLLSTAGLAGAALALSLSLSACGSQPATEAGASSGSPATPSGPVVASPAPGSPSGSPSSAPASPSPTASASAAGASCNPGFVRPGYKLIHAVSGVLQPEEQLRASAAALDCGPKGATFSASGPAVRYSMTTEVSAELLVPGRTGGTTVPISRLIDHVNDCTQVGAVAEPFSCHGNYFLIKVDSGGQIVEISEAG